MDVLDKKSGAVILIDGTPVNDVECYIVHVDDYTFLSNVVCI